MRDHENPNGDISIEYTGLRPGEKLYEELLIGNNVAGTDHAKILRAYEESLPWEDIRRYLAQLLTATNNFDCKRALAILLDSVEGFRPVCENLEDLVWQATREAEPQARPSREPLHLVSSGVQARSAVLPVVLPIQ